MFNEHVQKPPERLLALIGEINVGNLQRLGHEPHQSVAAGTSRGSGPAVLRRDPADRAGRAGRLWNICEGGISAS